MSSRRAFITLLGGAAVWPLAARAQQAGKVVRIGFFGPALTSPATIVPYQAFVTRLRELGFNEGQNIAIEYRNLDDPRGPFVAAADLMRLHPDLIVALGPEVALQAVVGASRAVPIVIIAINYDPIERGYVTSLARPGGNITGVVSSTGAKAGRAAYAGVSRSDPISHSLRRSFGRPIFGGRAGRPVAQLAASYAQTRKTALRHGRPIRQRGGGRGANDGRPVQPPVHSASPPDCRACGSASPTDHVHQPDLRRGRWPHVLRRQFSANVPRRRRLCG